MLDILDHPLWGAIQPQSGMHEMSVGGGHGVHDGVWVAWARWRCWCGWEAGLHHTRERLGEMAIRCQVSLHAGGRSVPGGTSRAVVRCVRVLYERVCAKARMAGVWAVPDSGAAS